jgi:hypothetical protein
LDEKVCISGETSDLDSESPCEIGEILSDFPEFVLPTLNSLIIAELFVGVLDKCRVVATTALLTVVIK